MQKKKDNQRFKWSAEKISLLKQNFASKSNTELRKLLGCATITLWRKAAELKLSRPDDFLSTIGVKVEWTAEKLQYLKEHFSDTKTEEQLQ